MGQLRNATSQDRQAFPGSTFAINDSVPVGQCELPVIFDGGITWNIGQSVITMTEPISGMWLVGKALDIILSIADDGSYLIVDQNVQLLTINHVFVGPSGLSVADIFDPGLGWITRNERSFEKFVQSKNQAYTYKSGQLYTDTPDPPMQLACPTVFNPD